MFGRLIIAFSLFQLCFCCAYAQVNLTGHINNYSLLGETRPDPFDETLWQNMTSQRFNFNWSINNNFDIFISSRTNFSIGNNTILKIIKETSTDDDNLMKLSYSLIDKDDKWLGIALDRLAFRWATDDFEITLGRQRINWGNTILWNPNDIFDSSPVINFTYLEKMGCDAVRARFYHTEVATSEIALSADRDGSPTAALLHRNNFRKFDYQLLGGVYKVREKVIEQKLVSAIKIMGGICPKLTSPGFDGMPDRLVLLPKGKFGFVEVKAPGEKPRPLQIARHELVRKLGFKVYVLDDIEQINRILDEIGGDAV